MKKNPLKKLLRFYVEQVMSEEKTQILLMEAGDDDNQTAEEPAEGEDMSGGEGLEDLSFGGDEGDGGDEGGLDLDGGDAGIAGDEGDLEGEEGAEDDDFDTGGSIGGGGGGGSFGGDFGGGGDDLGDDSTGEDGEEDGDTDSEEALGISEDPTQDTIDLAIKMLETTGDEQEILNAVKASIQRNFDDFEDAVPIIQGLWDTQQPILKVVARKLIIFIRGA